MNVSRHDQTLLGLLKRSKQHEDGWYHANPIIVKEFLKGHKDIFEVDGNKVRLLPDGIVLMKYL